MNMNEQQFLTAPARKVDKWLTSPHSDCLAHTHPNMQLVQGKTNFERARAIQKSLGTKVASRYLAVRGYSLECALFVLLGR